MEEPPICFTVLLKLAFRKGLPRFASIADSLSFLRHQYLQPARKSKKHAILKIPPFPLTAATPAPVAASLTNLPSTLTTLIMTAPFTVALWLSELLAAQRTAGFALTAIRRSCKSSVPTAIGQNPTAAVLTKQKIS
jgi:hypothetical protein